MVSQPSAVRIRASGASRHPTPRPRLRHAAEAWHSDSEGDVGGCLNVAWRPAHQGAAARQDAARQGAARQGAARQGAEAAGTHCSDGPITARRPALRASGGASATGESCRRASAEALQGTASERARRGSTADEARQATASELAG